MKKLDGKELLNDIKLEVEEQKKENKKMQKLAKEPKVYTLKQIIKAVVIVVTLLSLGGFVGITANNAINSMINSRVQSEVKAQVTSFTQAVAPKE